MQVLLSKMGNVLRPRLPGESAEGQRVEISADDSRFIFVPAGARCAWAQMPEIGTPEAVRDAFDRGDDRGPGHP